MPIDVKSAWELFAERAEARKKAMTTIEECISEPEPYLYLTEEVRKCLRALVDAAERADFLQRNWGKDI